MRLFIFFVITSLFSMNSYSKEVPLIERTFECEGEFDPIKKETRNTAFSLLYLKEGFNKGEVSLGKDTVKSEMNSYSFGGRKLIRNFHLGAEISYLTNNSGTELIDLTMNLQKYLGNFNFGINFGISNLKEESPFQPTTGSAPVASLNVGYMFNVYHDLFVNLGITASKRFFHENIDFNAKSARTDVSFSFVEYGISLVWRL